MKMLRQPLLLVLTLMSSAAVLAPVGCSSDTPSEANTSDDEAGGSAGSKASKSGQGGTTKAGSGGSTSDDSSKGGSTSDSTKNAGGSSNKGGSTGKGGSTTSGNKGGGAGTAGSGTGTAGGGGKATGTPSLDCSARAEGHELIDNMTAADGTQIQFKPSFTPDGCADTGTWFAYKGGDGTTEPNPFTFSALPSAPSSSGTGMTPMPSTTDAGTSRTSADASVREGGSAVRSEAGAAEGGSVQTAGQKGACIKGKTGSKQYDTSGMGLNFATITGSGNGGDDLPAAIDGSAFTGFQFEAWSGLATQTVIVDAPDKAQTPGYGVCDPADTSTKACGGATSSITLKQGWQTVQVAFKSFQLNKYYGGGNETAFDPTTITQLQWQVQQSSADAGAGADFDFCVYNVSFYK